VAPGELVTLIGRGLGPDQGVQADIPGGSDRLPNMLGGTQVFVNGIAAPVLFAQANQVNAIVPFGVAGQDSAQIQVSHDGQRTGMVTVSVVPVQPGVLTTKGSANGQAVVLNQDGSLNSPGNPAAKGSTVSIFATGTGQTDPPGADGQFTAGDLAKPVAPVDVLIGGIGADVIATRTPRGMFAGLLQVDARVPAETASGPAVLLSLSAGDVISPPATVAIR
jgi:uncharacterized protein (TIGR03437 family)